MYRNARTARRNFGLLTGAVDKSVDGLLSTTLNPQRVNLFVEPANFCTDTFPLRNNWIPGLCQVLDWIEVDILPAVC